jgi:hypothetical protein
MKAKLLLCFFTSILSVCAQNDKARSLEWGVTTALNYRSFSNANSDLDWLKKEQDSLHCPSAGFGAFFNYEFNISEKRSFFVGLAYSKQGYQYKNTALDDFRTYALNFHYVQLPVGCTFYFRANELIQFSIQPSLLPSFLITNRVAYQTIESYSKQRFTSYPGASAFSLHAQLAAGISVRLDPTWKFRAQLFSQYQGTPLTKGELLCRLYSAGIQLSFSKTL